MRRMFSILTVAGLMAVAVGAAATLTVDGGAIQGGEDTTLTCDDDGVDVRWGVESDEMASGEVLHVTIGDISTDCDGYELYVNVTDGDGNILVGEDAPVEIGATQELVHLEDGVDPEDIEDVHVIISS